MELVLEQTQQGTSYEVSVSAEGVEELKRKVKIKGEKKEALLTLRQKPEHQSVTEVFTMTMEILLEPTSNKLLVEHAEFDESNTYVLKRFDTSARNPVKEILLKLNLPDHRILKDGGKADQSHHEDMPYTWIEPPWEYTYYNRPEPQTKPYGHPKPSLQPYSRPDSTPRHYNKSEPPLQPYNRPEPLPHPYNHREPPSQNYNRPKSLNGPRAQFCGKGQVHDVLIECDLVGMNGAFVQVKHLRWKFRGIQFWLMDCRLKCIGSGDVVWFIGREWTKMALMWDVNSATGRYLSMEFIISDEKANVMHCTTRGNIAHTFLRLKEGAIYSVKNFTVKPNKDDFRVLRFAHFIVEMDEDTVVRRSFVRPNGFARYPFQLVKFDSLEPTNNKYLIDVVGYVTNVGRTTTTRSGSKTLDFHIANNCKGQSVRVTLWGRLGEMLIEKRTHHVGLYPIVLTAMSVKLYNNRLYLSSTSSTMIVDDEQIHVLKQFKSDDSIELAKELIPADSTGVKARTLENLLMWIRNRKYDAATFHCVVRIDKIKMKRGWNYPSCGGEKCKKGTLDRKHGRFWCDSCHSLVDYPVLRYRLELEVSDDTAQAVVVMFDETARTVVKCSAGSIVGSEEQDEEEMGLPLVLANIVGTIHTLELNSNSYYEHANYESFTCWSVILEEALDKSGSSGTLAAAGGPKTGVFVPLTTTPSVTTPSKPGEQKKPRSEERHDSDGEESFVVDSKTKERDVGCSSEAGKRRR
ncbi:reverse transcriptase domain-containing protein [Tanacetum coccineum]